MTVLWAFKLKISDFEKAVRGQETVDLIWFQDGPNGTARYFPNFYFFNLKVQQELKFLYFTKSFTS